jgi:hypothetical protein
MEPMDRVPRRTFLHAIGTCAVTVTAGCVALGRAPRTPEPHPVGIRLENADSAAHEATVRVSKDASVVFEREVSLDAGAHVEFEEVIREDRVPSAGEGDEYRFEVVLGNGYSDSITYPVSVVLLSLDITIVSGAEILFEDVVT